MWKGKQGSELLLWLRGGKLDPAAGGGGGRMQISGVWGLWGLGCSQDIWGKVAGVGRIC